MQHFRGNVMDVVAKTVATSLMTLSAAEGSYSASVIVLQESAEDVIRALTCRLGCHLRSDLSSPVPRNGCPLPWAESLAARADPDIASAAWLTLNLG